MQTRQSMLRGAFRVAICAAILIAAVAGSRHAAHALDCSVPLQAVGPIDPANGFPTYYQDSKNLALQPCLDTVCDPTFVVPDPSAPVSFPGNFPDEFFYHRAIASMNGPNGETFILVLGLTGSFSTGVPADGPGLPAGGVQTNQFSTVIGKRLPRCGDGYLDAGEQCDDGNVLDGDCCSATCRLEPNGSPCQDGDACTTGDTCSTGTCISGPP